MVNRKYAAGTAIFSSCPDRFVPVGYHKSLSIEEILGKISKIEKLTGVELGWPGDFPDGNGKKMKDLTDNYELEIAMVEIDTSTNPKYKFGMLTDPDKKIINECMDYMKKGIDAIEETGCNKINLWLGQEGYDYPLQVDYEKNWNNLRDNLKELASYNKNMKFCLEPKSKEPRTHCHVATVGKALLLALGTKMENIGVNIDTGHALMAYENMAESAVILNLYNKLFHLHVNDNFRYWDDDMVVGSIHLWETLELFYWLNEIGYSGWFSLDLFPYREGREDVCVQSIENIEIITEILSKIDKIKIKKIQDKNDSMKMIEFLREEVLRKAF
jgi:xylose isomerase